MLDALVNIKQRAMTNQRKTKHAHGREVHPNNFADIIVKVMQKL